MQSQTAFDTRCDNDNFSAQAQLAAASATVIYRLTADDFVVAANGHLVLAALTAVDKSLPLHGRNIKAVCGTGGNAKHVVHDALPFPAMRTDPAKQLKDHQMSHFVRNDFIKKSLRIFSQQHRVKPDFPTL